MRQLCALFLMSLAVPRIHAKLGPYYAHVCAGSDINIKCPGDFKIAFNGIIYTQYPSNYTSCGSVVTYDTTLAALCSSSVATSGDKGPLVQSFQNQCVSKSNCVYKLSFQQAISTACDFTDVQNVVRIVYSCVLTTAQDETVVCSDPATGKATTQFLACPANKVIKIDTIMAQSTGGGSHCSDPIGSKDDFEGTCAYILGPSHDFYRLVVDTCSGWTSCTVKGTLIENAQSNLDCAAKSERNFQRIYYSCVADQNLRATLCSNDLTKSNVQINCQGSYVKIINVVADRIYNMNPDACPVEDSAKNIAVFGCAVQVQDLQFLDSITRSCNGKPSCDVSTPQYVGAPCGADGAKTRNWFSVSYQCTKTPETDGYRMARACNGSQVSLKCPASAVMSLGSIYATVLFASGSNNSGGDYPCQTALELGNSEVSSCTIQLTSSGMGATVYNSLAKQCEGKDQCSVKLSDAIEGPECIDYSLALGVPRHYTQRQLYDVQYACTTKSDASSSDSTPVNSVGLGLGLAALFLVIIGAIVGVVIYRRRNRDGMTTKMSAPSAGNNYSNF